jgi:hydroxyacyl-ACP dehydratase HTD2-like protein with hotdog domain
MSVKTFIGLKSGPEEERIDPERVKEFARVFDSKNLQEVPPTYLTLFRKLEFELFDRIGFSLSKVLHAEQDYQYEKPLKAGMQISYETTLANVLEKRGSKVSLTFLVLESVFHEKTANGLGDRLATAKTTVVVREGTP